MKFVRMSSSALEQNLALVQEDDQIFFVATRAIAPRQELRVNYSPEYAAERNLPIPEVTEEQGWLDCCIGLCTQQLCCFFTSHTFRR